MHISKVLGRIFWNLNIFPTTKVLKNTHTPFVLLFYRYCTPFLNKFPYNFLRMRGKNYLFEQLSFVDHKFGSKIGHKIYHQSSGKMICSIQCGADSKLKKVIWIMCEWSLLNSWFIIAYTPLDITWWDRKWIHVLSVSNLAFLSEILQPWIIRSKTPSSTQQ